ncbi:MAG: hypothetical protein AAF716_15790 [Cyanobacteria bacterium P01_D01_bin.1]
MTSRTVSQPPISAVDLCGERAELTKERRSHIYYRDRLFTYPFSVTNALKHLGPIDVILTGLSYLKAWSDTQFNLQRTAVTADEWLIERFGTHLYQIFFKSYFEKVWGVGAERLSADCAEQSLLAVRTRTSSEFLIQAAANRLQHRSLIVVPLLVESTTPFPQQIYVHSPAVAVSHIQRYESGNASVIANDRSICLGLGYFCDNGDSTWQMSDENLFEMAVCELTALRLATNCSISKSPDAVRRYQQAERVPLTDFF